MIKQEREIMINIYFVCLGHLYHCVCHSTCLGSGRSIAEQPSFSSNYKRSDTVLGQIVRKTAAAIIQIAGKIILSVPDIGYRFLQSGVSDRILSLKPRQKAFNDRLFLVQPGFFDGIERFIFLSDLVLYIKKLIGIHDSLHGGLCIIQLFSLRDCINQVSADVCPAGQALCGLYLIVTTVSVTHQVSAVSIQKIHSGITGPCFGILVNDDWKITILTAAEQLYI